MYVLGGSLGTTYSDVEFNSSPQNQHCRISVSKGYSVNLSEPEDGANCCEEAEQEQAHDTSFLGGFNA